MPTKAKAKRNRDIVVLYEYEGMSQGAIAEKFRISRGRVHQIVRDAKEPFYRRGVYRPVDPPTWEKWAWVSEVWPEDQPDPPPLVADLPPPPPKPQRTFYGVWDDESNNLMGDRMNLNDAARAARQFPDARMFWYTDDVDEA